MKDKKSNNEDIRDELFNQLMKIRAITDVFFVIDPSGIEKNTLAGLGSVIAETAERMYESVINLHRKSGHTDL